MSEPTETTGIETNTQLTNTILPENMPEPLLSEISQETLSIDMDSQHKSLFPIESDVQPINTTITENMPEPSHPLLTEISKKTSPVFFEKIFIHGRQTDCLWQKCHCYEM